MSNAIKGRIMKHLAASSDSWSHTVTKVSEEVGSQFFTEQAMKALVEGGQVERMSDGKYKSRLDKWPTKIDEPLTPEKAV